MRRVLVLLALVIVVVALLLRCGTEEAADRASLPRGDASTDAALADLTPLARRGRKTEDVEATAAETPAESTPAKDEPTFDLGVTVVDADGEPAANTDVWIVVHDTYTEGMFGAAKDPRPPKGHAKTDQQGKARLTLPLANSWGVHALSARGADSGISKAIYVRSTDAHSLRVELTKGVPIRVRVTNSLGHEVPDCIVDMVVLDPITTGLSSIGPYGSWVPAISTVGGVFEFPTAPTQKWMDVVFLRVRADGYLSGDGHVKFDIARKGTIKVVLRRAVRIEGRLVDADGQPVAGGRVTYVADNRWKKASATGADDGRFVVHDAQDNGGRIDVRGPETRVRSVEVPATTGDVIELGDIELSSAKWIAGRVVDRHGAPVAGVQVYVRSLNGQGGSRWTSADAGGRFSVASLDDGPHRVFATEGSKGDWDARTGRLDLPAPGAGDVEVVLVGALLVEVHIAFAKGDEPGPVKPYTHVWARRRDAPAGTGASIDVWSRGRYRLRYKAKSNGLHDVHIEMVGYVTAKQEVEISGEHETRVDVTLRKAKATKPK